MHFSLLRLAPLLLILLPSIQADAASCDARSLSGKDAKISPDNSNLDEEHWTSLKDCTNLHVDAGKIEIRGIVGGVPKKLTCGSGEKCTLSPSSNSLFGSLTSTYTAVVGGNRMDENVVHPAGIPYSDIYDPKVAARFDFSQQPISRFALFEENGKKPVFETALNDSKVVTLPDNVLVRGKKYSWHGFSGGAMSKGSPSGNFALVDSEDAAEIQKELAQANDSTESPAEKLYDKMAVYYTHDLYCEMAQLRASAMGGGR